MNPLFLVIQNNKIKLVDKDCAQKIYIKLSKRKGSALSLTRRITSLLVAQASMMLSGKASDKDTYRVGSDTVSIKEIYSTATAMLENIYPLIGSNSESIDIGLEDSEIIKAENILNTHRIGDIVWQNLLRSM